MFYELKARLQSSHLPCLGGGGQGGSRVSTTPGDQNQLQFSLIKLAENQGFWLTGNYLLFLNLTFGLGQAEVKWLLLRCICLCLQ